MDELELTPPPSRAGSRWLAALGLTLALAGAVFTVVLWIAWQRAEQTRTWTPVNCRILSSQLESFQPTPASPLQHRVQVRYSYDFAGQAHSGSRIKRVDGPKSDFDAAQSLREQFTPGQQTQCWVNPADPSFAILQHDSRAALYTLWFPLLFVVGGLRMAWAALRR